jgi:hypothetical protein
MQLATFQRKLLPPFQNRKEENVYTQDRVRRFLPEIGTSLQRRREKSAALKMEAGFSETLVTTRLHGITFIRTSDFF